MTFRFSGHETFPCRYTWLPKAFRALEANEQAFSDEEQAIVQLGVGKNMVRAIRFWVQVIGVAEPAERGGYQVTPFGTALLNRNGFDPYLEDIRTLWLIHWQLSSQLQDPLFAWDYLLNRWQHPEISRTEVLRAFRQEVTRQERTLSKQEVTSTVGRLGVKARAAGIYLVFAAQRPDVNVMPMQLRANLGNRLILRVDSEGTSEIALGEKGAEQLLGRGHLLAKLEGAPTPIYAQVPSVDTAFMQDVVDVIMGLQAS